MKAVLALALACALGGCATISRLEGTTVSPQVALTAANSFDALETLATGYLQLPPCGGTLVVCRTPVARAKIIPAVNSGRTARDVIEKALRAGNGAPIPVASYNTLTAAIETLQSIYAQYNIH